MNYSKIYSDFINNRRLKESALTGYSEKHHIIPKSLGGDNSKSNIINLAPEDHYFAHMLLARYAGSGMKSAFYFMSHDGTKSASGIKPTRHTYAWARKHFMENLPDHITDVGGRLAKNEKRIAGHKKWVEKGEISETVKARYRDPEYYKRWVDSQKDVWTKERRDRTSKMFKEYWKDPVYRKKMKERRVYPGWKTSEHMKEVWRSEEYRRKISAERKSRYDDPEYREMFRIIGKEIGSRPEVKAKISVASKKMWGREGYKESHIKKLRTNARRDLSCWWHHEDHGHVYGYSRDMSERFGGNQASWCQVKSGHRRSIFGWIACKDHGQFEFDEF